MPREKSLLQRATSRHSRTDKDNKAGFENETVRAVCDNCEIDIPDVMIDNEVDQMANDQAMRMQQQGISLDMYLGYIGQSMDEFKEGFKPMARVRVKSSLVVEKISEKLDPEVTDADIDEEIAEIAKSYNMDAEEVKKSPLEAIKEVVDSGFFSTFEDALGGLKRIGQQMQGFDMESTENVVKFLGNSHPRLLR